MSNKGNHHTEIAKRRIGAANQKSRAIIDSKSKEYLQGLNEEDFPSVTECALHAGIAEKNLIAYEMSTADGSKIRQVLDELRDRQKLWLLKNGIKNKANTKIAILLLQAQHGLTPQAPSLTQTNIFNVSPDVLAEALSRQKAIKGRGQSLE